MLKRRFPRASTQEVREARAYAYGGSLIQDLGYYPFGSHFFTNLVHYVRSGDFIAALIRESHTVDEYAFALGALSHYASDNAAHPTVNHALPMIYPKLRAQYGDDVLFADSPARHVMVEFAFDVLQVARGHFKSDAYQNLIGFEVARPLLERAFYETYGLELKDVFGDVDLAIGTYRKAASQIIPDVTRAAWREKRDEILAVTPDVTEQNFVYTMSRQQYEEKFGTGYRKPGFLVRFVVAIFKVIPKFGPFKPLAFEPLTPETERMFLDSFAASREHYGRLLRRVREGRLSLRDTDLDTGRFPARDQHAGRQDVRRTAREAAAQERWHNLTCAAPGARRTLRQSPFAHLVGGPEMNRRAVVSHLREREPAIGWFNQQRDVPENCRVLHHRAGHRNELAAPQQTEVAMSKRFERGRSHARMTVSSRERGHGWTDGYLRSVIVIGDVSVNLSSVSLATSAASPCVASDAAAPPPPPTAAPIAAPLPPLAIAPIAAPMPAPIPTFLASLPFVVFASWMNVSVSSSNRSGHEPASIAAAPTSSRPPPSLFRLDRTPRRHPQRERPASRSPNRHRRHFSRARH